MSIVTGRELLTDARARHYAVAAFNTNNLEYMQAILEAAAELSSPVIVSAAKSEIDYMNGPTFVAMVRTLSARFAIPMAIHLDHGPSYDEAVRCINYGFTSVMYDGSRFPLDENIAVTKKVVEAAHACGISVEGEIGVIGQAADNPEGLKAESGLASPVECERFVKETGSGFLCGRNRKRAWPVRGQAEAPFRPADGHRTAHGRSPCAARRDRHSRGGHQEGNLHQCGKDQFQHHHAAGIYRRQ